MLTEALAKRRGRKPPEDPPKSHRRPQEILAWSWADQQPARPGGSHDKGEDAATEQPQEQQMSWQAQNTRRQRQRNGRQSGMPRRIDSKGHPHPRWASLRVGHAPTAEALLASLRAHNISAGEGALERGWSLRIARSFPGPGNQARFSGRPRLCGNRSTWNKPRRDAISYTLPLKARGWGQEYRY